MKINNQVPAFNQAPKKAYKSEEGFANLIDEQTCSGDEYYWQHQNQLQASELQFDALNVTQAKNFKQVPVTDINSALGILKNPPNNEAHLVNQAQDCLAFHNETVNPPDSIIKLNATQIKQEIQLLGVQETRHLALKQHPEEKQVEQCSLCFNRELKKHHLFISQYEAELTLNTHDLKQEEAQALIPLIKNYLKKEGLLLKKLIINGVHHD
jgi:hypothetical protein